MIAMCPKYSYKCDTLCVFICRERGTERDGEWREPPLEICSFCGAKILPYPPYKEHECRDMEELVDYYEFEDGEYYDTQLPLLSNT